MKILKLYRIFKTNTFENFGDYYGYNKQEAINNMAKKGNLTGNEFEAHYYAVLTSMFYKSYKPSI